MRVLLLLAAAAVSASMLAPAPLRAQSSGSMETGSLITNRPAGGATTGKKDARSISRHFAACTIRRGRGSAERYLATPVGAPGWERLQHLVLVDECLGTGELRLPFEVIRGALFEQLYLTDYKADPVADLTAVAPIDYAAGYSSPVSVQVGNAIALGQFGDCVARADSAGARNLLTSLPDSSGETAAVHRLMPRLGACIPAGRKITFSKSVLRAAVAEGLYRLTRAAEQKPWGAN